MYQIKWEDETFRVVYSNTFDSFKNGGGVVNVYVLRTRRRKQIWDLKLINMAPSILKKSGFPDRLVKAAELTTKDGKPRTVKKRR